MNAMRPCPSMLVDESLVFDLGPEALGNIRRSWIETERLSSVFISHCHADHISDLIPFLGANQIGGRKNPLYYRTTRIHCGNARIRRTHSSLSR